MGCRNIECILISHSLGKDVEKLCYKLSKNKNKLIEKIDRYNLWKGRQIGYFTAPQNKLFADI